MTYIRLPDGFEWRTPALSDSPGEADLVHADIRIARVKRFGPRWIVIIEPRFVVGLVHSCTADSPGRCSAWARRWAAAHYDQILWTIAMLAREPRRVERMAECAGGLLASTLCPSPVAP